MSKTKGKTRAQEANANEGTKDEQAAAITNAAGEDTILTLSGRMLAAVELEAGVIEAAELQKAEASGNAWAIVRDTLRETLQAHGHKAAGLVLTRFKDRAALVSDKVKARAGQYAALLNRAVKAAAAGKEVPVKLWAVGREAWSEAAFWRDAGIMSSRGRKAANGNGKTARTGEGGEEGGETVGKAAMKATADKELSEVMEAVAMLKGPFRKEWMREAKELAIAILARQAQASGGSR